MNLGMMQLSKSRVDGGDHSFHYWNCEIIDDKAEEAGMTRLMIELENSKCEVTFLLSIYDMEMMALGCGCLEQQEFIFSEFWKLEIPRSRYNQVVCVCF